MRKHLNFPFACFFALLITAGSYAQQGNVAAGGEATGTGGSMSYSIGQVDYLVYSSPQGSLSLGLQQPWFTVPLVLEIPETIITEGQSLCFNATQTVIVAGNAKQFIVEPNGIAEIIAGLNILMKEGTTVESGGSLHAYISTTWCSQPENLLAATEAESSIAEPIFDTPLQSDFFKVYPNPTIGDFTLELLNVEEASLLLIEIYTMQGHLILSNELPAEQSQTLSMSGRQPGIYIIKVLQNKNIGISKIIKQ